MSAVKEFVDSAVEENDVLVFSKTYCPYCSATKKTLKDEGANAKVYELDTMDDGDEIQSYLATKTGQRTVPNIFIHKKHIGGNSDLQAIKSKGQLKDLLA
ncbi:glutaredoxin Grx1 [Schizosaccharomyces japonicus yFS275]|uniref:Glutaredoxin Grx1 n=1 Tax=Schizosaccharomyces japonicus (strain yFS275 / FY16936) TaxID=402676 RepID=B6K099_SCHJY|nr:glutaredoxin Grx1 [Schizosaccharomyces japonicus yFS275]EEB06249.1 glutaredoxin Grx1 [Schizosaccharomyces japonicus yFS275]